MAAQSTDTVKSIMSSSQSTQFSVHRFKSPQKQLCGSPSLCCKFFHPCIFGRSNQTKLTYQVCFGGDGISDPRNPSAQHTVFKRGNLHCHGKLLVDQDLLTSVFWIPWLQGRPSLPTLLQRQPLALKLEWGDDGAPGFLARE
jgi:hypothetical protein